MAEDSINKVWRYRVLPHLNDRERADQIFEAEKLLNPLPRGRQVTFVYRWYPLIDEEDEQYMDLPGPVHEHSAVVTDYDPETMILTVHYKTHFRFNKQGLFEFQSGPDAMESLKGGPVSYSIL